MSNARGTKRRMKRRAAVKSATVDSAETSSANSERANTAHMPPRRLASSSDTQVVQTLESYLTFRIGGEVLALPIARAREIARCESTTKVPNTPPCVRGVMNLRGTVIPVIDLAPRFGRELTTINPKTCVVLVDVDWTGEIVSLGLLVEGVGHVVGVPKDAVDAPPPFGTRLRAGLLLGLIPVGETFAAILDADRALTAAELLEQIPEVTLPGSMLSGSASHETNSARTAT